MTQFYKVLVVVAAVGVISLIHAMTSSEQGLFNHRVNGLQVIDSSTVLEQSNANSQINALFNSGDSLSLTSVSQTLITNNIYQGDTGSFYIELEHQADQAQSYLFAPLLASKFDVSVTGNIVRTKVTQTFRNESEEWQNGVYVFPLPADAAVDAMLMQIDERKIEGKIQEKAKAEAAFEAAKLAGKSASLVSQLRPNMFVNKIANVAPNANIIVTIEYQQMLHVQAKVTTRNSQYELRIPSAITPRYTPSEGVSESALNEADHAAQPSGSKLSIEVAINMGVALSDISSEHHLVHIEAPTDAEQKYRVFLDEENVINKEFVLTWQMKEQAKPIAAHLSQNSGGYQYGLIQIIPPAADAMPVARDLTFILDTSGSMVGEAIEQAKMALTTAIAELQDNDTFNVIEFNSGAQNLWSSAQVANSANKAIASQFVNSLQASGGTEIAEALHLAFSLNNTAQAAPTESKPLQQILFITDGSVSNEAQLLKLISNNLQEQRLFTIGIGSAPNTYFMSEAAIAGRGTFTLIGDISQVNVKMSELLAKIKRPALSDVQVKMNAAYRTAELEIYPSKVPDIYSGEPITLVYRVAQHNVDAQTMQSPNFTLQAQWHAAAQTNQQRPMLWQSQLPTKSSNSSGGIAKHWAYNKIQQLTRDLHTTDAAGEDYLALQQFTQRSITDTALKHHLVSEFTSLIAIDEQQSRPSPEFLAMLAQKKQVDVLTNKQWSATQMHLPQTSTMSTLYVFMGIGLSSFALLILVLGGRK
ncbi:marine proteobacterial sortase target protein [Glaciecola sp. SC05]|uniref:marine proteobacterial sortase target protein n=1 Tax=Glaciecola sp. SC05 TaxID=1987355 RepID=UPI003527DF42